MKAFTIHQRASVFVYSDPVSMSYGFPRLRELAGKDTVKQDNNRKDQDLYVFCNKKRTYMKVLFYSKEGWCIFAKRLEGAKFDFEDVESKLSQSELTTLIDQVIKYNNGGKSLRGLKVAA